MTLTESAELDSRVKIVIYDHLSQEDLMGPYQASGPKTKSPTIVDIV